MMPREKRKGYAREEGQKQQRESSWVCIAYLTFLVLLGACVIHTVVLHTFLEVLQHPSLWICVVRVITYHATKPIFVVHSSVA